MWWPGLEIICRMQWSSLAGGHKESCTTNAAVVLKVQFCKTDRGTATAQYLFEMPPASEFYLISKSCLAWSAWAHIFYHWITLFSVIQAQGHPFAQYYASPSIFVPSAILWSISLGSQGQTALWYFPFLNYKLLHLSLVTIKSFNICRRPWSPHTACAFLRAPTVACQPFCSSMRGQRVFCSDF